MHLSEASLWLKAVLCFWWDRSCTNSPKKRLISVLLLGRKMSPRLAAVERTREIPGLPHHTALLKLPRASHLQKPRSQKVRWCFAGRGASGCVLCVWGRLALDLCLPLDAQRSHSSFHMHVRVNGQSCLDSWSGLCHS